jgi:hypothetical protein
VWPPQNLDLPLAQLRETLGHPVDGNTCVPVAAVVVNDQPKWPWIRQARQAFERAPIRIVAAQIDDPYGRCCCCAGTAATWTCVPHGEKRDRRDQEGQAVCTGDELDGRLARQDDPGDDGSPSSTNRPTRRVRRRGVLQANRTTARSHSQ